MKFFSYDSEYEMLPNLKPAKSYIPEWYKKSSNYVGSDSPHIHGEFTTNLTFKKCIPVLDAITSGYVIELWTDVEIKRDENGVYLTWLVSPAPIQSRDMANMALFPTPMGADKQAIMAWISPWYLKVPKGYSALFTHPLNRHDLPFVTTSGIMDLDNGMASPAQIPFFIKENFEGIIPAGTPIIQVLPFKRDNWQAIRRKTLRKKLRYRPWQAMRSLTSYYKKNLWHKKEYI